MSQPSKTQPLQPPRDSQPLRNSPSAIVVRDQRTTSDAVKVRARNDKDRKAISSLLGAKKSLGFAETDQVVQRAIQILRDRGDLFHDGETGYLFLRDQKVLIPIDISEQSLESELVEFGLYPKQSLSQHVIDGLRIAALKSGKRTNTHCFAYFDRTSNTAYVYDFAGGMFRFSPAGVEHIDNGRDGILFIQNPQWEALKITTLSESVDWRSWLVEGIRFQPTGLTEEDQRTLLLAWVLSMFFPQLLPTRPILAMIGEKGSGKSSLLRRLGQLIFGPKFNVTALTSKPDDFDAAITTDPLVVADNADDAPGWLPDRLAVVATGGTIKRRVLYTTNRLGNYPIRASLAITSRTPNFRREDIAERLLPIYLQRIELFGTEEALLADARARRDDLMSSMLRDVAMLVRELGAAGSERAAKSKLRMADFANFMITAGPVISTPDSVTTLLSRLGHEQVSFATDDEPLIPLLDAWFENESHVNLGRTISTTELEKELSSLGKPVPWIPGSARSFGQYLRERKGSLMQLYGMSERSGHAGSTSLTFEHLRRHGDFGDLGDDRTGLSHVSGIPVSGIGAESQS